MKSNNCLVIAFFLMLALTPSAYGQSWVKKLGKKVEETAKQKVEQHIERKTGETVDKGVGKAEDAVSGKKQGNDSPPQSVSDGQDQMAGSNTTPIETSDQQTLESYTKYDFVPGDQILFFEDFSQDAIGDFPALWTTNGSGEIKTLNNLPGKWLQITSEDGTILSLLNKLTLPVNFILEFDYIPYYSDEAQVKNPARINWYASGAVKLYDIKDGGKHIDIDNAIYPGNRGLRIWFQNYRWSADGYKNDERGTNGSSGRNCIVSEQLNHIIIWVQGRRVRIYHGGAKIIDGPTLLPPDMQFSRLIFLNDHEANRPFFSNIKITTAAPDTRGKLLTEGKLVSYGISFDVNKDIVKPESYGALNDIAKVLKENPEVKVSIVGHTDADGNDASNLDLSRRRAASVKSELVKNFSIDTRRLETDGKGASIPLAPNTTSEGKAKNRRVEFIKL